MISHFDSSRVIALVSMLRCIRKNAISMMPLNHVTSTSLQHFSFAPLKNNRNNVFKKTKPECIKSNQFGSRIKENKTLLTYGSVMEFLKVLHQNCFQHFEIRHNNGWKCKKVASIDFSILFHSFIEQFMEWFA